ncbi:hypothetical protein [Legionella sp. PC997]|uniref:hypothetical protein n=1 Tax=Legionella sp. PC997 TaxID=2755562 RepID=UPI0015FAC759|nr:hypothetical protein [Legionella sp. PC997]QMT59930.1 hypothetical protein HBNCFIEN_01299 [Legionella sp. PC997]
MANQGKIINVVNFCLKQKGNIDFTLNKKGICAGLAALYIKYATKNTKESLETKTAPFFDLLTQLANLPSTYCIGDNPTIDNFIIKIEKTFRADEYSYYEVLQTDVEKILDIENKPLRNELNLGLVTTEAKWKELFKQITRNNRSYSIFSNNHAITLSVENGKYVVYDPNYTRKTKQFETIDDLIKEIKDCFDYKDDSFGLAIRGFAPPSAAPEQYPSHNELHKIAFANQVDAKSSFFAAVANDTATLEYLFQQDKISFDQLTKEYFRPEFNNLLIKQPVSPVIKKAVLRGIRCNLYVGNLHEAEKLIEHYLKTYTVLEDQEELKIELQLLLDEPIKQLHLLMRREVDHTRVLKLLDQLNLTVRPKNQTIYNHLQLLTFIKKEVDSPTIELFLNKLTPEQIVTQVQYAAIANQHHVLHLLFQHIGKAKITPQSYPSIFNQELIEEINVTTLEKLLRNGFLVNIQDPDLLTQCMQRNDKTIFETYAQAWLTQSNSTLWEHVEKREYDLIDLTKPLGSITLLNALIFLRKNEHVKRAWNANISVEMIKSALTIAILNGNKDMSLFLQEKLQSQKANIEPDTLEFLYEKGLEESNLSILDTLTYLNFNVLHKTKDIRALFILCSDYDDYSVIKTCLASASPEMKKLILESSLNWNIAPVIEICAEKAPELFNDYLNTNATNTRNLAKLQRAIPSIPRVPFSWNTNPQEQKKRIKDLFKNKLPALAKTLFRTVQWETDELKEFLEELIQDKNENGIKLLLLLKPELKQEQNLIARLAKCNFLIPLESLFQNETIIINEEITEQVSVLAKNEESLLAKFFKQKAIVDKTPKEGLPSQPPTEEVTPQTPEELIELLKKAIKEGQEFVLKPFIFIINQVLAEEIFTSALTNNNKRLVAQFLEQKIITPHTPLKQPLVKLLKEAIEKGHDAVLTPFIESNLDFGLDYKELFLFSCEKKQTRIANQLLSKQFYLMRSEREYALKQLFGENIFEDKNPTVLFETLYKEGYGRLYQLVLKSNVHNPRAQLLSSLKSPLEDPSIQKNTVCLKILKRAVAEKNEDKFNTLYAQSNFPNAPDKVILDALKDPILFEKVFPLFERKYTLSKLLVEALHQEAWETVANLIEHKKLTDVDLELQKVIQDHAQDIVLAHLQNLEAYYDKLDVRPRLFQLLNRDNPYLLKELAFPYQAKIYEALQRIELKMLEKQLDLNNHIYRYTFDYISLDQALEELAKIFEECQKIISEQKIDLDQPIENPEIVNHLAQIKIVMAGKDVSPDYLSESHYQLLEQLLENSRFKEVCRLEFKLHCLLRQFQKPLLEQNEKVSKEFHETIKLLRERLVQANLPEHFVLPAIQHFFPSQTNVVSLHSNPVLPEPEMKDNPSVPSKPASPELEMRVTVSVSGGHEKEEVSLPSKTVVKKSHLKKSNLDQLKRECTEAMDYYLKHRDQTLSYFSYFFDYYCGQIRAKHYLELIKSAQTEQQLDILKYAILVNDDTTHLKNDLMFKLKLQDGNAAKKNLKVMIRNSFGKDELPHIDALIESINQKANGSDDQATSILFQEELDYLKHLGKPRSQGPMKSYSFFNTQHPLVGFLQWVVSWLSGTINPSNEHKLSSGK